MSNVPNQQKGQSPIPQTPLNADEGKPDQSGCMLHWSPFFLQLLHSDNTDWTRSAPGNISTLMALNFVHLLRKVCFISIFIKILTGFPHQNQHHGPGIRQRYAVPSSVWIKEIPELCTMQWPQLRLPIDESLKIIWHRVVYSMEPNSHVQLPCSPHCVR